MRSKLKKLLLISGLKRESGVVRFLQEPLGEGIVSEAKTASLLDPSTSVLIVDDNAQFGQILKRILEQGLGYLDVVAVATQAEAKELLYQNPERFRLLLIDYEFPAGDSGGSLIHELKNARLLENKAALLITSDPTVDRLKEAITAGALGVVAKPFDREELRKQISKAERALKINESTQSF